MFSVRCSACVVFLSLTVGNLSSAKELLSGPPAAPRARVVVVNDPQATEAFVPQPEIVRAMVDKAIVALTGQADVAAAWASLVKPQDVVGLKVFSAPGAMVGTRPAVVAPVVQGLLAAHVPADHIVIWDRRLEDLRNAGYAELAARFGVRLAGSVESGFDDKVFYESPLLGNLLWGDLEFSADSTSLGRKSHVTKLVSRELTKIISITPLLNSYDAGVAGNLYGLAHDSVDNTWRFDSNADSLARAVPEIYALPVLGDRVVLNVTDALICQYEGGQHVRLHNATPLNEIRVSLDPVALDVLSVADLARQRTQAGFVTTSTNHIQLFQNAVLLELGVNDLKRIQVETVK